MPRVLILSHGFQSEYEVGFTNGIAALGLPVTLVGSDNTLSARLDPRVNCINLRGSQDPRRSRIVKFQNIWRYVCAYVLLLARDRGAVVHMIGQFTTSIPIISLVEAWLMRLVAGRYILTVHNLMPHDRHSKWNRLISRWTFRAAGTLMVHTAKTSRRVVEELGRSCPPIVIVEHGIDRFIPVDAERRKQWREAHGIPSDALVALFFGVVARYKGVDLLLEAFRTAGADHRAHLMVAGMCRDAAFRAKLATERALHPFAHRIHWIDAFIPADEVADLMRAADFLVMPYRHIDQSGVLFMALSSGLPILTTNVGSLAEYVKGQEHEIVPPEDVDAIIAAFQRMLEKEFDASRDGRIAVAEERYAWRHTVLPLLATYRALAMKSRSGACAS